MIPVMANITIMLTLFALVFDIFNAIQKTQLITPKTVHFTAFIQIFPKVLPYTFLRFLKTAIKTSELEGIHHHFQLGAHLRKKG